MKIEELNPTIRFADRLEYTSSRPLSKTYDSRLIYVIDGGGSITVSDRSESISRGLLVLFQSGVAYKFEPKPSFVAFAVDFDLVGGYLCDGFTLPVPYSAFDGQKAHERAHFDDSSFLKEPFLSHVHAGIGDDIRRLVEEYNSGRQFSKRRLLSFCYSMPIITYFYSLVEEDFEKEPLIFTELHFVPFLDKPPFHCYNDDGSQ